MKILTPLMTITTCFIALVGCERVAVESKSVVPKVTSYEIGTSASREVSEALYIPAVAHASDRSQLSFRVAGEIQQLNVKEGDRIKKGSVIAALDPTDYQLDVDNSQASYNVANSQYKRSKPLVEKGFLAKSQFDELAAERDIALRKLQLAKLKLSFTQLLAPMDGIVSRIHVDQFENIQVGQQVINILSLDEVEISVQVPDRFYVNKPANVNLQQNKAVIRVESGNEYLATLKEFTTEPDPQTGSFTVTLTLPMPKEEFLLDGMAVDVAANKDSAGLKIRGGRTLPIEAIFNADGDPLDYRQKYVWAITSENKVVKTAVKTGNVTKEHIQVISGLEGVERVVIGGVSKLQDGMTVEPMLKGASNE